MKIKQARYVVNSHLAIIEAGRAVNLPKREEYKNVEQHGLRGQGTRSQARRQ
jgi:hypothetical protein